MSLKRYHFGGWKVGSGPGGGASWRKGASGVSRPGSDVAIGGGGAPVPGVRAAAGCAAGGGGAAGGAEAQAPANITIVRIPRRFTSSPAP